MSDSKENQKIIENFDYLSKAASASDCTGLIPFLPTSKAEIESYNELYQYLPTAKKNKDCQTHKNTIK